MSSDKLCWHTEDPRTDYARPVRFDTPRLAGYHDVQPIGEGGFSNVFRAMQDHIGRPVAVKVLRLTMLDKSAAEQFRAEARALGRLDGFDNVLRVYGADVLPDGRPYLVTELCDGSLAQLLDRRGPLDGAQATEIGYQITRGLLAAHGMGILHGDITPRNVLLRPSGVPVLADFGLAVLRDYGISASAGHTPAHAAPEILRDDAATTVAADVYGLGSTLYTALAGTPPFPARSGEDAQAHALRMLAEEPAALPPTVPQPLRTLVFAMLAKDPAHRPTLAEVANRLRDADRPAPATGLAQYPTPAHQPSGHHPSDPNRSTNPYAPDPNRSAIPYSPDPNRPVGPYYPEANRPAVPYAPDASWSAVPYRQSHPGVFDDHTRTPAPALVKRRRAWPWWVAGGAVTAAAMVVGAVLLFGGGSPPINPAAPTSTTAPSPSVSPAPTVALELAEPQDFGDAVELSWKGPPGLSYSVSIAPSDGQRTSTLVNQATTQRVPVRAGVQYCFRIEGTDGRRTYVSNVKSLRGAICRFN
jgi:serine/threonine protein kinase